MAQQLHKTDVRVRRRIMHHITRRLNKEFPAQPGQTSRLREFEYKYKDIVHDAITVVLLSERMAVEALARKLAPNGDD